MLIPDLLRLDKFKIVVTQAYPEQPQNVRAGIRFPCTEKYLELTSPERVMSLRRAPKPFAAECPSQYTQRPPLTGATQLIRFISGLMSE